MNSCQNFTSCIWTATDLGHFVGNYLGPAIKETFQDAEIWYGTYERPFMDKIDTIMQNPVTSQYIKGVSFQWAGKQANTGVHTKYPDLKLMQSETECGNGICVYTFWNSVLDETGKNMWGWKQNSMVTINSSTKKVVYNPECYIGAALLQYIQNEKNLKTFNQNYQKWIN